MEAAENNRKGFKMRLSSKSESRRFRRKFVKGRFEGKAAAIPSAITSLSIFCGFLALITGIDGRYRYACICIALSFVLDGLDGRVARKLNATSDFGRELDSLSDVVSFGVAPAVLAYFWAFKPLAEDFGILISFLFVVCGALRLARFNVRQTLPTSSHSSGHNFEGLPIPAAAATLVSVIYWWPKFPGGMFATATVLGFVFILSLLMVSTIPFASVKHIKLSQVKLKTLLVFTAAIVALCWYKGALLFVIATLSYVLSGPVGILAKRRTAKSIS